MDARGGHRRRHGRDVVRAAAVERHVRAVGQPGLGLRFVRFVPGHAPGHGAGLAANHPAPEKVVIQLAALERQDDPTFGSMRQYIDTIKLRRGDFNGRVLSVRTSDVWALAAMAKVDPESLIHTLERLEILRASGSAASSAAVNGRSQ